MRSQHTIISIVKKLSRSTMYKKMRQMHYGTSVNKLPASGHLCTHSPSVKPYSMKSECAKS